MSALTAITVRPEHPPVVQIDTAAGAAYVKFSPGRSKVARTEVVSKRPCFVTLDYSASGVLLGVEVIGAKDYTLAALLALAGVTLAPKRLGAEARYVPSGLRHAA